MTKPIKKRRLARRPLLTKAVSSLLGCPLPMTRELYERAAGEKKSTRGTVLSTWCNTIIQGLSSVNCTQPR